MVCSEKGVSLDLLDQDQDKIKIYLEGPRPSITTHVSLHAFAINAKALFIQLSVSVRIKLII